MIDLEIESVHGKTNIANALDKTFRYATALSLASSTSFSTFTWLRVNSLRHIPFLDFDVICGASPRLHVQKRFAGETSDQEPTHVVTHPGTAATKHLLETLSSFVIPPGTTAEILDRKRLLSDKLSVHAGVFLKHIRNAVSKSSPINILLDSQHHNTRELLIEDLSSFSEDFKDRSLLQSLLDRATSAKDLLGGDLPNDSAKEVFKASFDFLQARRPSVSTSNVRDAMNAYLLARCLGSKNMRDVLKVTPILVSQTRAVQQLGNVFRDQFGKVGRRDAPFLFAGSFFLMVSEGLLARTEGRYMTAADAAAVLAQESKGIADTCADLLRKCNLLIDEGRNPDQIEIDELPSDDWKMLLFQRKLFQKHWGSIVGPLAMVGQRDRQEYLDFLLSFKWRKDLRAGNEESFTRTLREFVGELKETSPEDYDLWDAILKSSEGHRDVIESGPEFSFFMRQDDGTLLREIASGGAMVPLTQEVLSMTHDIQVAVMPAYLSCGAFFTGKSFRDTSVSSSRYFRFTWLHNSKTTIVANALCDTAKVLSADESHFNLRVYTSSGEVTDTCLAAELRELLSEMILSTGDGECCLISADSMRCFADLVPLEGTELQFGVTVPVEACTNDVLNQLVRVIATTSEIPLNPYYARHIINLTIEGLGGLIA
jgi:hypothetical protein